MIKFFKFDSTTNPTSVTKKSKSRTAKRKADKKMKIEREGEMKQQEKRDKFIGKFFKY